VETSFKNAMGAMAEKVTMAKRHLEKMSWHPWQKKDHDHLKSNPFRAAWCFIMMNHHDSS